ncbi:MAG: thioredoxin [Bacteroidales bacterium]|nr:thioredoxin [Bacteroidota bacterium]MBL6949439.1 thioredoxin [Bacteroidales bacterium]
MKKLTFFIGFALIMNFTACSGNTEVKDSRSAHATIPSENSDLTDQGKVQPLSAAAFKKLVWDYSKSADKWIFEGDLPVIIDFYADWCRPCKIVAPILDELAKEYKGKIRIYKIDTEKEKELARVFNIRSIPAVLFVPTDDKPQMSVGALPKPTFKQAIREVLNVKE